MTEWNSNSHSKFLLQYHVIFVCKYRKKLFTHDSISEDIKQLSYDICNKHQIIIKHMETDKDHIHYMIIYPNTSGKKIHSGQTVISYVALEMFQKNSCENTSKTKDK